VNLSKNPTPQNTLMRVAQIKMKGQTQRKMEEADTKKNGRGRYKEKKVADTKKNGSGKHKEK
jgi:hypothetical protein